jgi:hypothetical protein
MKNRSIRVLPADPVRSLRSPLYGRTRSGRVAKAYTRGMRPVNGLTVKVQWHTTEPEQLTVSSWQTKFLRDGRTASSLVPLHSDRFSGKWQSRE